jgi:hypothetical protein
MTQRSNHSTEDDPTVEFNSISDELRLLEVQINGPITSISFVKLTNKYFIYSIRGYDNDKYIVFAAL